MQKRIGLSDCIDDSLFLDMIIALPDYAGKSEKHFCIVSRKNISKAIPDLILYAFWVNVIRNALIVSTPAFYDFRNKYVEEAKPQLKNHGVRKKRIHNQIEAADWLYKQYLSNQDAFCAERQRYDKRVRANDYGERAGGFFRAESL